MLVHFLPQIVVLALIHLLFAISPGPDFAIVTRNTLLYSRKIGICTAFGIALGILIHTIYAIAGIALLISQSPVVFSLIKYAGAAYIAYIGYRSIRAALGNMGDARYGEKEPKGYSGSAKCEDGDLNKCHESEGDIIYAKHFYAGHRLEDPAVDQSRFRG